MIALVLLSLALNASAADDASPPLVDKIRELRGSISAERPTQVKVGDPWNDENRQRYYDWEGRPSKLTAAMRDIMLYESPTPFEPLLAPITDPFSRTDANKIAQGCRQSFPNAWDRIGCVSKAVHEFFHGFKFDGLRSFCRSHAHAFNVAFDALDIKRSVSKVIDASGGPDELHVANLIIVTTPTGMTYSYVIDNGWFPGTLFPENEAAIRFHDRDGDGRTDFTDLPVISENPDYSFKPSRAPAD